MTKFRWRRTYCILLAGLLFICAAQSADKPAEVIDGDPHQKEEHNTPPEKPSPQTPLEKPSPAPANIDANGNINEPDFKVTLGPPKDEFDSKPFAPAHIDGLHTASKAAEWSSAEEEGTVASSAAQTQAVHTGPEPKEELSPALASALAKERAGKSMGEMIAIYEGIVAAEPQNAAAHYHLGVARGKSGDNVKAFAEVDTALKLSPNNPKYQCDYGLLALRNGSLEVAIMSCLAATQGASDNARYQSALGDCLLAANRVQQASAAYTRAVHLDPNNPAFIYNLGVANLHAKSPRHALELFNEAIRLKPKFSTYYCGRGLAHESLKDIKLAIMDYRAALGMNDNNAEAHYMLANLCSDPDDPTYTDRFEAVLHADRAVKLTQNRNALYLMGLARAKRVMGSYDEAATAARQAVKLDPSPENKKQLARFEQEVTEHGK